MRTLGIALLLLAGLSAAAAQSRIDRIDVIEAGTYRSTDIKTIASESISTGQHTVAKKTLIERKTVISIQQGVGVEFGARLKISGAPRGGRATLHVVWRYPEPGLRNPDTGVTKLSDEYDDVAVIGNEPVYSWIMSTDWVKVPGTWILELWDGKRILATQAFSLVKE